MAGIRTVCDRLFLGTDSAPHAVGRKESACGCAGVFSAHCALELCAARDIRPRNSGAIRLRNSLDAPCCTSRRYAEAFEEAGCLDHLEAFASTNGANFYGLPLNEGTVTLKREAWTAPATLPFGDEVVVPFRGGETVQWRLQR